MKIFKTHKMASGEILALVDARTVPPGIKRSGFNVTHNPVEYAEGFVSWGTVAIDKYGTIGPASPTVLASKETGLSQVRLADVVKVPILKVDGEFAIVLPEHVLPGVPTASLKTDALLNPEFTGERLEREYRIHGDESKRRRGPEKNPYSFPCVHLVKTQDLVDAALAGKTMEIALAHGTCPVPDSTLVKSAEKKIRDRESGCSGGVHMTKAESEAWSAQLRAKVQTSEAEKKAKEDARVGWDPYEGDEP